MPANARPVLLPGDPAPWFHAAALDGNPDFAFNTVAGRPLLLLFYGSAAAPTARAALDLVATRRALFDDVRASFFGVTIDRADVANKRIAQVLPGIRHFVDLERRVSTLYGATDPAAPDSYYPFWLLLDRAMQVIARFPLDRGEAALDLVASLAPPPADQWAPVLLVPRVFEPALCRRLIDLYEAQGGTPSGFMRDVGGKTTLLTDPSHKRRSDCSIEDEALRTAIAARVRRRIRPLISRAFQFDATRMERYIVGCYDSGEQGFFRPHRDNTTAGTAHRRFAVTINLNAEDYEGGELRFPEFGPRTYRAPTGGAVVFSCSLLHEATPVTAGRRYAFLPFLYDDAAAKLREANNANLDPAVGQYRAA